MDATLPPFDFVREYYPLAPHTFYRIGGVARWAFLPRTSDEVRRAYAWMTERKIPVLVMGAGSNMLIDDNGFSGGVLFTTELKSIEPVGSEKYRCGAGVTLSDIVTTVMLPNNYTGVGALTGIPGTLGGALYMNAGTVNGSICQFAEIVTMVTSGWRCICARNCTDTETVLCGNRDVIMGATVLTASTKDESFVYRHYIQRRRETQPQGWCWGSVFKNPPENHAGRLIEACGLKVSGGPLSAKHANFIKNDDNASFEDVRGLIQLVKDTVFDRCGIMLEEEVRIITAGSAPEAPPAC